jgi:hypothetical protein
MVKCYIEYYNPNPFNNNKKVFGSPTMLDILIAGMIMRIMQNLFMLIYAIVAISFFLVKKIKNLKA